MNLLEILKQLLSGASDEDKQALLAELGESPPEPVIGGDQSAEAAAIQAAIAEGLAHRGPLRGPRGRAAAAAAGERAGRANRAGCVRGREAAARRHRGPEWFRFFGLV